MSPLLVVIRAKRPFPRAVSPGAAAAIPVTRTSSAPPNVWLFKIRIPYHIIRKPLTQLVDASAIPNATVPKSKRDLINISGVLSAGKKRGPSPSFFTPPPHPPSLGLFSALICNGTAAKKRKEGKKWSNAYTEGGAEVNRI
jgi:hypothetical protein